MAANRNQNLLLGLIAVHEGKISAQEMARFTYESQQQGRDLGECLLERGLISEAERGELVEKAAQALEAHGGKVAAAISSLWRAVPAQVTARAHPLPDTVADPPAAEGASGGAAASSSSSTVSDGASVFETVAGAGTFAAPAGRPAAPTRVSDGSGGPPRVVPAVEEHPGRYKELRTFAKGGMGRIVLVHDTHLGRDVAFKQLLPELSGQMAGVSGGPTAPGMAARFVQEARITGQLEHPSIIPVYEMGYRDDGSLYYTMRFVRGKSLEAEIEARPRLEDRLRLLPHFLDLCHAVAYAHSRGVIHRDLKPLNVLVGEFGETVVIDWGIAKAKDAGDLNAGDLRAAARTMREVETGETMQTAYGQTIGSPMYMSPEQAAGALEAIDERSDVYGLGAVLYAILTGRPPYHGLSLRGFLERVAEFPPKPVGQLEKNAPKELAAVCARAMARAPEERYATARELAAEIEQYLSGGLVSAYTYAFHELARRFVRRYRTVLATAAAAAVLLLFLGVYSYVRVRSERDFALAQQRTAEEERSRAQRARDEAEAARSAADTERSRAERELYFANIALARRAFDETRVGQGRGLLESAPAAFRDWEWGFLMRQAAGARLALNTGGIFLAWSADGARLATLRPNGTLTLNDAAAGAALGAPLDKAGFGVSGSADAAGNRFAVASQKSVFVWDWAKSEKVFEFNESGAARSRYYVSLSADGTTVAALNTDKVLRVWNVDTGKTVFERPAPSQMGFHMQLSPRGDLLLCSAAGGGPRVVEALRMPGGELAGTFSLGDVASARASAFSPDGAMVCLASDTACEVRAVDGWRPLATLSGAFSLPDCVAFSPDGAWLAAGDAVGDLILWNTAAAAETRVSKAHLDSIRAVAWAPDGRRLVTAGFDRAAHLWDAATAQRLHTFKGHDRSLLAAAFSPDGKTLATGSFDGGALLWDLTEELLYSAPRTAAFHPGTGLVAGALPDAVAVWDGATLRRRATLETPGCEAEALAFDRGAGRVASVLRKRPGGGAPGPDLRLTVWRLDAAAPEAEIPLSSAVDWMTFCGADDSLVALRQGNRAAVYALSNGALVWEQAGAVEAACAADGGRLAVCALVASAAQEEGGLQISILETATWKTGAVLSVKTEYTAGLAFSPSGKWLALGAQLRADEGWNCGAFVWDTARPGAEPVWLGGHNAIVSCVAFNPREDLVATGGKDGELVVWRFPEGARAYRVAAHTEEIRSAAFSPDGARLATAGRDGFFKLWGAEDGREILTLQPAAQNLTNRRDGPHRTLFSADGSLLFTLTEPHAMPPLLARGMPPAELRKAPVPPPPAENDATRSAR